MSGYKINGIPVKDKAESIPYKIYRNIKDYASEDCLVELKTFNYKSELIDDEGVSY